MRILGFGTYDTSVHPRVGVILDGFRAHGDTVLEVNEPLGFSTAERVEFVRRPWTGYRFAGRLAHRWWQIAVRARAVRRERWDAVVVGYLGHFDVVVARLLFPRETVVLDLLVLAADTARDRGVGSRLRLFLLAAIDRLAMACATVVVVDTDEHLALLPPRQRPKGVVVPVGATKPWFDAAEQRTRAPRDGALRVVFFGLFTPLQGAPVIGEALGVLAADDQIRITMIGAGQELPMAREASRHSRQVTWLDWVDARELPRLVSHHDVCLGIFGTSDKAHRVVPNKVYQGGAAGCAIVTSDTVPQRRVLRGAATLVPPGDADALVAALRDLAADPRRLASVQAASRKWANAFRASAIVVGLRARLTDTSHPTLSEGSR